MNYNFHINYQCKNSGDFNPDNDKLLHPYIIASLLFSLYWEGEMVQVEAAMELSRKEKKGLNSLISLKMNFHITCDKFPLQVKSTRLIHT